MTYQISDGLHDDLKKWGCYFLSVLRIFELILDVELTVSIINRIYKLAHHIGYVGDEAYMIKKSVAGVSQIASSMAHQAKLTTQTAYIKKVTATENHNYFIARYMRTTNGGETVIHFVLVDSEDRIIYDPWSAGGSKTAREGKLTGHRYIWGEIL